MIHIFEHMGVNLQVEYDICPQTKQPTFHKVRVLDFNYRPVGPDLTSFLHSSCIIVGEPTPGKLADAATFLSAIAADLP